MAHHLDQIQIIYLENREDGLRKLQSPSWSGACLILSRKQIESALRSNDLKHSGVYILVGPNLSVETDHGQRLSRVYIGKSDSLHNRITEHDRSKSFWRTAYLFYRATGTELHAGEIAELEAKLIDGATNAGTVVLHNATNPKRHHQITGSGMDEFVTRIQSLMLTLGQPVFSEPPAPTIGEASKATKHTTYTVPPHLQSLVDAFKMHIRGLPNTETYATDVPDIRARLLGKARKRAFAGLHFRRSGVLIVTHDGNRQLAFKVAVGHPIPQEALVAIHTRYEMLLAKASRTDQA